MTKTYVSQIKPKILYMKQIQLLFVPDHKWSQDNSALEITREEIQTRLPFPEENSQDFKTSADKNTQMQISSEKENKPTSEHNYIFSTFLIVINL